MENIFRNLFYGDVFVWPLYESCLSLKLFAIVANEKWIGEVCVSLSLWLHVRIMLVASRSKNFTSENHQRHKENQLRCKYFNAMKGTAFVVHLWLRVGLQCAWPRCLINATRIPIPQNRWCNKRLTNAFNSHNLSCLLYQFEWIFAIADTMLQRWSTGMRIILRLHMLPSLPISQQTKCYGAFEIPLIERRMPCCRYRWCLTITMIIHVIKLEPAHPAYIYICI